MTNTATTLRTLIATWPDLQAALGDRPIHGAQGRAVTYVGDGWPAGVGPEVVAWGRSRGCAGVRPTCDLVSRHTDGSIARLIEVKGRGAQTSISLPDRQRNAMLDYGVDWWLYVALNCTTTPELRIIENPSRLPWRLFTPAADIPAGSYRRVSAEGVWHVGHDVARNAGQLT
ncbi:DUF3883 domain-containing protein [Streptomyces sp. NPDC002138]|uniref:DUF3883 domain-containing protein n=1 Tax=Streptomyces sp. NPDC002138 TaxID=3154410 RepID=UPI00331BD404